METRDLISRGTAKITLKNYGLNRYMMERMERWIDAQPAVDVVSVVHGEWIERYGGISKELFYQCSKCYGEVDTNEFDYCPWCGAKMKGADDE